MMLNSRKENPVLKLTTMITIVTLMAGLFFLFQKIENKKFQKNVNSKLFSSSQAHQKNSAKN